MGFLDEDIVVTNSANSIYTNQIYIFGILSSAMHMVWVRAVGGKLEDRLRYSKNVIYNTFPFPKITEQQKEVITKQVYNILDEREKYPGKTLAELYDTKKMPYNLKQAHEFLDEVIDRIYRVKPFENDEERLAHLFKLYEEMVEKEKQESKK
jgi:GTP-sensing pleiotropic transcriptional regulator CodY